MNVNSTSEWLWSNCVYFFLWWDRNVYVVAMKKELCILYYVLYYNKIVCVWSFLFQEFLHVTHLSQMSKVELWAPNDKERIKLQKRVLCVLVLCKNEKNMQYKFQKNEIYSYLYNSRKNKYLDYLGTVLINFAKCELEKCIRQ